MTVDAISHHFSDGLYAKQMRLEKNHIALSHVHHYSHLSILAKGEVYIKADGVVTHHIAPDCIEIKANVSHEIQALKDSVFFCCHATNETDIDKIDEVLIKG